MQNLAVGPLETYRHHANTVVVHLQCQVLGLSLTGPDKSPSLILSSKWPRAFSTTPRFRKQRRPSRQQSGSDPKVVARMVADDLGQTLAEDRCRLGDRLCAGALARADALLRGRQHRNRQQTPLSGRCAQSRSDARTSSSQAPTQAVNRLRRSPPDRLGQAERH